MLKILLFDDHEFVTEAISSHIENVEDMEVVGVCQTLAEFKLKVSATNPDVVISDVLTDEDTGFSLFQYLTTEFPDIKIFAYTSIGNAFIIDSLLEMGVLEVINKKESIAALIGKVSFHVEKNTIVIKNVTNVLSLTPREKQIAELLKLGWAAKEISNELGTSQNTINNQKNALLEKFNCTNSTELVVKLSQMGLIGILK